MASAPPPGAPAPARLSLKDVLTLACTVVAAAAVVFGVIRGDGQREQRLLQVETDVRQLQQRDDRRQDLLNAIDVRTARIEATLQMMTKGTTR